MPWIGHECQKHPSTKTTTRDEGKTKSGLTDSLGPSTILRCLRQPDTPSRLNALANASSVDLLPRDGIADITRERFSLVQMSIAEASDSLFILCKGDPAERVDARA